MGFYVPHDNLESLKAYNI
ncbi:hypothetical protein ZYGR_0AY00160 [Zygosaccharomyces rouxii]|uniref:Uncharacterized protein n=1 Tax=Zygosaccharomyces rouxii TaxID=4956 RepID=A0A1Q3AIS6_ZYGRO|nr:hypothetical protein ZYGR_0AY00160 [Zygosaccharomyces rouxii]